MCGRPIFLLPSRPQLSDDDHDDDDDDDGDDNECSFIFN